jgi:hypothetical protein
MMVGRDMIVSEQDEEFLERCEAYEAFIAASKENQAIFKQLTEANLELRNDFKKLSELFHAYINRHNDLDAATISARKRSRELEDVYEKLKTPTPKPRRVTQ